MTLSQIGLNELIKEILNILNKCLINNNKCYILCNLCPRYVKLKRSYQVVSNAINLSNFPKVPC